MATVNRTADRQQGFFSVLAQSQTWRNLFYLLIIVPLALLHAGLIALGALVILGIAGRAIDLSSPFNLLGLLLIAPALGIGLFIIAGLLDMQSWVNHKLLAVDRIISPRESFSLHNALAWCSARIHDRWLWTGLLYLLVITLIGAASAGFTLLFIGFGVALFAGSVSGDLTSVQIAIGSRDLEVPGIRLFMILLAPVVAIAGLHLANVMAGIAARIGTMLLGPHERPASPAPSLSSMAETAYAAPRGDRATTRTSW